MRGLLLFPLLLTLSLSAQDNSPRGALLPLPGSVTPPEESIESADPFSSLPQFIETGPNTRTEIDYINDKITVRFLGDVSIKGDNGMQAYANRITLDVEEQTAYLSGNVSIYQGGLVYRGESAVYHHKTRKIDTQKLRAGMEPLLLEAGQFRSVPHRDGVAFIGENAGITTHDAENPDWWLRADKTTIFPGDRVVFKNLKLKAGDRTLFWLPYLSQPLNAELGYHFLPGGRSNLGLFLQNRYGVMLGGEVDPVTGANESAWLLSHWHADIYSRRGLGLGVSLFDTRVDPQDDFGWLKFYYMNDLDPSLSRSGVPRPFVNEDRFRAELAHRLTLLKTPFSTYAAHANLTWLSDAYYLEDLDPSLYNINPAPDNTLGISRRTGSSYALLNSRVRPNSYYQSDTRFEFSYDWIKQPFLDSNVLYESQTSLGLYREYLADFDRDTLAAQAALLPLLHPDRARIANLLDDRGFARFHSYHEWSRPSKIGHLTITPKVGGGYTSYGSVEGPGNSTDRSHLFAGVDFSTKLTKAYPDWIDEDWGLDGALHVLEPYATLSVLSTNELDPSFDRIDRLTATTRPQLLGVGRFTAIDDLANWSIMRLGMRNRIMTHRNEGNHDWLTVDTYFNTFFQDPEFNRDFSNLYNEIRWHPLPWFALELDTQVPLFNRSNFTEVATTATVMPNDRLEVSVRHRLLKDHPILRDSNRMELEFYARLNEYWGIGTRHRWEVEDSTLELQQYNIYYDFDSWVGSVGLFQRENRIDNEYGIMFSFALKEFPSMSLPIRVGAE
ncbi:MAG: LPS-assembly protein LptD [Verrucomicrobiaceae bacterium]